AEQRRRLVTAGLALTRPPATIAYEMPTPAGRVRYGNKAALAVVAALMAGVRSLADIPADFAPVGDLVANMLALCAGGDLRPVEMTRTSVGPLNRALRRRLGGPKEIPVIALPRGTALEIDHRSEERR